MVTYSTNYPAVGYATALANLGGTAANCAGANYAAAANACLIDAVLATGVKSGYNFTAAGTAAAAGPSVIYTSLALPTVPGQTGQNAYCSDQSGVLYYDLSGTGCTNASNPL
jgi:type IV pilus assembly protein PilA